MSNYGIFVKNNLLEPKHMKAMQVSNKTTALWLYLWFLDKITKIDEKTGLGIVLGRKPIKATDIVEILDCNIKTARSMFKCLQDAGYIKTIRTPYGYQVYVTKAVKIFGNQERKAKSGYSLSSEVQNLGTLGPKSGYSKKTVQLDNTISKPSSMKNDNYIDYETGEVITPKPKSKTPSADVIALVNLFEKSGEIETGVKPDTTRAYFKVINSMKSHNLSTDDVKSLFTFFFKDPKLSKEKKVSLGLCISGAYITQWKVAQKNKPISQVEASLNIRL